MTRRHVCFGIFLCAAVLAAGLRTDPGQGYSDPVVRAPERNPEVTTAMRTLEVRLTNRKTGRLQLYKWRIPVAPGGLVKIECHEWVQLTLYGHQLSGFPKNRFRRSISVGIDEEGFAEPYDFVARWHPNNA